MIFIGIVALIFIYAYIMGRNLTVIKGWTLADAEHVFMALDNAGSEGDDENVSNMNIIYDNTIKDFDSLYEKSDLIAKVTLKQRTQKINVICSEVEVLDVFKGNQGLINKQIQVYEPFGLQDELTVSIFGACLPMRDQEEYIVFLKLETNGRYNLVSGLYGKYHVEKDRYMEVNDRSSITLEEVMKYDMLDISMSKDKELEIEEMKNLGGLDAQMAEDSLASYQRMSKIKDVREQIRASFQKMIS